MTPRSSPATSRRCSTRSRSTAPSTTWATTGAAGPGSCWPCTGPSASGACWRWASSIRSCGRTCARSSAAGASGTSGCSPPPGSETAALRMAIHRNPVLLYLGANADVWDEQELRTYAEQWKEPERATATKLLYRHAALRLQLQMSGVPEAAHGDPDPGALPRRRRRPEAHPPGRLRGKRAEHGDRGRPRTPATSSSTSGPSWCSTAPARSSDRLAPMRSKLLIAGIGALFAITAQ